MGLVLIAMSVRVVVGLVLECVFIVGGEVAVAIWALAGWVVADLVAETPSTCCCRPAAPIIVFLILPGPACEARTAKDDSDGCVEESCLSAAGAGFQT